MNVFRDKAFRLFLAETTLFQMEVMKLKAEHDVSQTVKEANVDLAVSNYAKKALKYYTIYEPVDEELIKRLKSYIAEEE